MQKVPHAGPPHRGQHALAAAHVFFFERAPHSLSIHFFLKKRRKLIAFHRGQFVKQGGPHFDSVL